MHEYLQEREADVMCTCLLTVAVASFDCILTDGPLACFLSPAGRRTSFFPAADGFGSVCLQVQEVLLVSLDGDNEGALLGLH